MCLKWARQARGPILGAGNVLEIRALPVSPRPVGIGPSFYSTKRSRKYSGVDDRPSSKEIKYAIIEILCPTADIGNIANLSMMELDMYIFIYLGVSRTLVPYAPIRLQNAYVPTPRSPCTFLSDGWRGG